MLDDPFAGVCLLQISLPCEPLLRPIATHMVASLDLFTHPNEMTDSHAQSNG